MFPHYTVIAVRRYLVPGAIALRTMIAVFGVKGDRSFILDDRASEKKGRSHLVKK